MPLLENGPPRIMTIEVRGFSTQTLFERCEEEGKRRDPLSTGSLEHSGSKRIKLQSPLVNL